VEAFILTTGDQCPTGGVRGVDGIRGEGGEATDGGGDQTVRATWPPCSGIICSRNRATGHTLR
jgi:hypothetical protein